MKLKTLSGFGGREKDRPTVIYDAMVVAHKNTI